MNETAGILARALALVRARGWRQGDADRRDGGPVCCSEAIVLGTDREARIRNWGAYMQAVAAFRRAIETPSIVAWNDQQGRGRLHVEKAFRRAIEFASGEHNRRSGHERTRNGRGR